MNRLSIPNKVSVMGGFGQYPEKNLSATQNRFLLCNVSYEVRSHKPRDRLFGGLDRRMREKIEALVRLNLKRNELAKRTQQIAILIFEMNIYKGCYLTFHGSEKAKRDVAVTFPIHTERGGCMEQIIFVSGGLLIFLLAVVWVLAHWSKQIASCLPSEDGGMIGAEHQAHGRA